MSVTDLAAPFLPQELIDHIIDHLHDDQLMLRNCSLVCRAWLPTSRIHLFSRITFKVPSQNTSYPPQELCKRLYRLLTNSPDITGHIRELEIYEGCPNPNQPALTGLRSTTWITIERTLPPLLKKLTHLRRVEFGAASVLHWQTLPIALQSAIQHIFSLSSLVYIRLKSWSFPNFANLAALLSHCQHLKGLSLSSTKVGDDGKLSDLGESVDDTYNHNLLEDDIICGRHLEFLTLDYVDFGLLDHWLHRHRSIINVRNLRELRVAHCHDVISIERLLLATGSSLEHFHLKPGPWDGRLKSTLSVHTTDSGLLVYQFDLSHNAGLRSIRLTLEDPALAIDWVKKLLSSISPSNVLERVGVEFYTDLKKMEGWAELDSLLIRPELSALRQVEIGLFSHSSHPEFIRVTDELSGLTNRGILRIYQLGIKSQRSSGQLTPRISRYEYNS